MTRSVQLELPLKRRKPKPCIKSEQPPFGKAKPLDMIPRVRFLVPVEMAELVSKLDKGREDH